MKANVQPGERHCPQCYRGKPVADFKNKSGGLYRNCSNCRKRYSGWGKKTLIEKLVDVPPRVDAAPTGRVLWVPRSLNQKLGGIPASWSERGTCPPSCGLYEAGCYASYGKLGFHWKNVTRDGLPWEGFLEKVRGLEESQVWRHNVAGDLQGSGQQLDVKRFTELVEANRGRRGFTFTHRSSARWRPSTSLWQTRTVSPSIYPPTRRLKRTDWSTSRSVRDNSSAARRPRPGPQDPSRSACDGLSGGDGRSLTCLECQLCAIPDRKTIIGFSHLTENVHSCKQPIDWRPGCSFADGKVPGNEGAGRLRNCHRVLLREETMSDVDVRKKAMDLLRLATNEGATKDERDTAMSQMHALIGKYDLLAAGGKPINVAAEIFNKVMSGTFMEEIAGHVEKTASAFERVMAAGKRITDARGPVPKKRRRTYR